MLATIFSKAFIVGLIITGGLGPIAFLCIRRSMLQGFWSGFATGIGAALGDGIFAFISFFCVNLVHENLINHSGTLRAAGGLFFVLYGFKMILIPQKKINNALNINLISDCASGLALTLANPTTLIPLMALFAGFGLSELVASPLYAIVISAAVFFGSFLWWIILSISGQLLKTKINEQLFTIFNTLCGIGLILFGCLAILSLIMH